MKHFLLLAVCATAAGAQTPAPAPNDESRPASCAAFSDDSLRLQCYDRIAAASDDRVEAAKRLVTRDFLDPEATQFRDVFVSKKMDKSGDAYVCGEVNGKNAYGAYVGYRRFLVTPNSPLNIEDVDALPEVRKFFETLYEITCVR